MKTVRNSLEVFVALMRGDDYVRSNATLECVERPFAAFNHADRLVFGDFPRLVCETADVLNAIMGVHAVRLVDAPNPSFLSCHSDLPNGWYQKALTDPDLAGYRWGALSYPRQSESQYGRLGLMDLSRPFCVLSC